MAARDYTTTGTDLLSDEGRKVAFKIVDGRCPVCCRRMSRHGDKRTQLTLDHVVAHNNGGGAQGNLVPLCGSCNSSKRDADLDAWLPARLVKTGRATTIRGARRVAKRISAEVEEIRAELEARLREKGIW